MKFQYLAAGLCLAFALTAHAANNIVMSAAQLQTLGIRTAAVSVAANTQGVPYPATVSVPAGQMRVVAAPMMGLVSSVLVASNDTVKAGQPLARLASPGLAEAQRNLVQAAVQAQLARQNLKRDDQLLADGIISAARQQATRAAYLGANAMLVEQRQSLRMLGVPESLVRQMEAGHATSAEITLVAPISGVVLEVTATPGQRVDSATALFKVAKLDPLWLEISVPAKDAAAIRPGEVVTLSGRNARGSVLSVARAASTSQTVSVRVEVRGDLNGLMAGQAVEARIAQSAASGWQVPAAAVAMQQGKSYVFVRSAQGFTPVAVRVLGQSGDTARVEGALKNGAQVAVQGVAQVKAVWMGIGGEGGE
ncbi:probable Co/Zn/Cd efflux system membrane fusion protein [Sulfuriferula multivorans]|uniref:Probable Co/Zn/Cd efflux system membrane fusion protein n=1 Tax=Sulfuriferula multivorans TaxID=1559896 RepID=A0A401JA48_9PROT|nr:efflux RND transporter periplasmic adaptor subunit [Sulfuriferula multivorans]GBL44542.1 probable Co/Zn/Cd efflux system membrane fusion protein [Sulfuriferula multivorans]